MGFELFNDVSVSDIKTDSIYNINDNDDIMLSSSDSDDDLAKATKSQMQTLQKNLLKKTKKLVKAIGKLEKYKYENTQLRSELDSLMDIANQWLKEKETLLERIRDLEASIEFLKHDNSSRTVQLEIQIEDMKRDFSEQLAALVEERVRFKREVDQEFAVNEALKERQADYIEVLKKELILARNIIKTPVLLEQTYKKVNLDDVEFYRHELVHKEPDVLDIDAKAKARRDRRAAMSQNERDRRAGSLEGAKMLEVS